MRNVDDRHRRDHSRDTMAAPAHASGRKQHTPVDGRRRGTASEAGPWSPVPCMITSANTDPQHSAGRCGEDRALDDTARPACPARAKRDADRQLAGPARSTDQREVRDVRGAISNTPITAARRM